MRKKISFPKFLPNIISLTRLIWGGLFFWAFNTQTEIWFLIFSLMAISLSGFTDFWDGRMARKHQLVSETGKWLDPFSDFAFFFLVYFSLFQTGLIPLIILLLFSAREIAMYAYIRPALKRRRLDAGAKLSGKIKTVGNFLVTLLIIPPAQIYFQTPDLIPYFPIITTILYSIITIISVSSLYWYIQPLLNHQK